MVDDLDDLDDFTGTHMSVGKTEFGSSSTRKSSVLGWWFKPTGSVPKRNDSAQGMNSMGENRDSSDTVERIASFFGWSGKSQFENTQSSQKSGCSDINSHGANEWGETESQYIRHVKKEKTAGFFYRPSQLFQSNLFRSAASQEEGDVEELSEFEIENGYTWEAMFAFKVREEGEVVSKLAAEWSPRKILDRFAKGGIETSSYISADKKHIICLLRAPQSRLLMQAEDRRFDMQLDAKKVEQVCRAGLPEHGIGPIILDNLPPEFDEGALELSSAYARVFAPFRASEAHLFKEYPCDVGRGSSIMSSVERLTMLNDIIATQETVVEGEQLRVPGCGLSIRKLIAIGAIETAGPLHDTHKLETLWRTCVKINWTAPWDVPFDDLRDYLGVKDAFFFVFMRSLTKQLFIIAIPGIVITVLVTPHPSVLARSTSLQTPRSSSDHTYHL
jgi:hypothetical protein